MYLESIAIFIGFLSPTSVKDRLPTYNMFDDRKRLVACRPCTKSAVSLNGSHVKMARASGSDTLRNNGSSITDRVPNNIRVLDLGVTSSP